MIGKIRIIYDSVLGKRVLTYWENRGNPDYSQINGFMVGTENFIFMYGKEENLIFPENV